MFGGEGHRGRTGGAAVKGAQAAEPAPQGDAEAWARVKRRLRAELGEDVFTSWFARLEIEAVVEGCAHLTVPTRFLKSWIEAHYADRVLVGLSRRGRAGRRHHDLGAQLGREGSAGGPAQRT